MSWDAVFRVLFDESRRQVGSWLRPYDLGRQGRRWRWQRPRPHTVSGAWVDLYPGHAASCSARRGTGLCDCWARVDREAE